MLRLAFDFIITWRETRTRPNAYLTLIFSKYLVQFRFSFSIISQIQPFSHTTLQLD